jgi:ketosteroid isomerase-like protein
MYSWLIARFVRLQFARVGRGNHGAVLRGVSDQVHHRFAGNHALGGDRHDKQSFQRWLERLSRLFPEIDFQVVSVSVRGWPWNFTVAAEWKALVTPAAGPTYTNSGVHVIVIHWGRVVRLFAYEDSQAVAEACRIMADHGMQEAAAPPITS